MVLRVVCCSHRVARSGSGIYLVRWPRWLGLGVVFVWSGMDVELFSICAVLSITIFLLCVAQQGDLGASSEMSTVKK